MSIANGGPSPTIAREGAPTKTKDNKASTGASAATIRALTARMFAFYFRAPMKAFFRARIDYMGYARAINPRVQAGEAWSWRTTSPVILAEAVRKHGWSFLPNQVLPPLLANTAIGAVLYTTYLTALGRLHEPSASNSSRTYPPPSLATTLSAGAIAGSVQSLIAAPLDALQVRFQAAEFTQGKYRNMWHYALKKTIEIGPRGVFGGWSLSFIRDSVGFAAFFGTFELIKAQCFYKFVSTWYGLYDRLSIWQKNKIADQIGQNGRPEIRPHYMLEPAFLLMAGAAASVTQAVVQHPIARVQEVHYGRLEWIDSHSESTTRTRSTLETLKLYRSAYSKTIKECLTIAHRDGGVRRWLYRDFFMSTLRQVPSTSAGLIVFEVLRRKWGAGEEHVRIEKDGYDILLL